MSSNSLILTALIVMAAAGAVRARPSVDLVDALNKTTCPIQVEIDENKNRIPRRIKLLKCAPEPARWCAAQGVPRHECCQHAHHSERHHYVMQCVELRDTVLVRFLDTGLTGPYDVAVGCTCMVEPSTVAKEAT